MILGKRAAGNSAAGGLVGLLALGLLLASASGPAKAQDAPPEAQPAVSAPTTDPATAPSSESTAPAKAAETDAAGTDPDATAPTTSATTKPPAKPSGPLVVVSWGGAYSQSQEEAIYRPFTRSTGIDVSRKVYAGGLDVIRAQLASGEGAWDVVDVEPADAQDGCDEGLFQERSVVLPAAPDGTAATADFLPGTLQPCAVGALAWSMVLAYAAGPESARADDAVPASLQDFFDLDRFPGKRGLRRTPMANLEWALLADGAAPAEVYDLLRTEAGIARAFAKLDTIRDDIVWWEDAGEPARLLSDGSVAMTTTFNAPIFAAIAVRQRAIALIWDRQIWDIDLWAVPVSAPNREAALEFIRFATSPGPLARQTRWIPYGPVRLSSAELVGDYVHADIDMATFLPTPAENLSPALRNDALFWREQGPALVERFNAWLAR
ncbi:MAG: extracellular solute-binding protein [Kiloniellaceae bacterium]